MPSHAVKFKTEMERYMEKWIAGAMRFASQGGNGEPPKELTLLEKLANIYPPAKIEPAPVESVENQLRNFLRNQH